MVTHTPQPHNPLPSTDNKTLPVQVHTVIAIVPGPYLGPQIQGQSTCLTKTQLSPAPSLHIHGLADPSGSTLAGVGFLDIPTPQR